MNEYDTNYSDSKPKRNNTTLWLIIGLGIVFLCICCAALSIVVTGYFIYEETGEIFEGVMTEEFGDVAESTSTPRPTRMVPTAVAPTANTEPTDDSVAETLPTPRPSFDLLPGVPDQVDQQPVPERALADLNALYNTEYPNNNYYDTAVRLGNYDGPRTLTSQPVSYSLGDVRTFYNDTDQIEATLMAITPNTYFWVDNDLNVDAAEIAQVANRYETQYHGPLTELFGQVWTPGVDNDPRFSVLHISQSPGDELGYFSSEDEYTQEMFRYSNEQELIYMNLDQLDLGEDLYYATLVHEIQHLIQWHVDSGEAAWLNEGLSQLAELYLGFDDTANTRDYLENPATRLDTWVYDDDQVYAHYAAGYLFSAYLWEQLGDTAVQELVRHPATGLASVRAILQGYAPDITLEQFVADWMAANYLDHTDIETDPRYYYQTLDLRRPTFFEEVERNGNLELVEQLEQFGVHYIDLRDVRGKTTITFAGDTAVPLLDPLPTTDNPFWYAPAVDEMNAHLTGVFDLRNTNRATLTYSVWYDLEESYDFAYLSISIDGGQSWEVLNTSYGRDEEYGDAYNGRSDDRNNATNGWLKESISLDNYTGNMVQIRFDVLTDAGLSGHGFAVDNIAVTGFQPATFTDGPEGWQAEGFVLTAGWLPQKWVLLLIDELSEPMVTALPLNELNQGQFELNIGKSGAVLAIMPQTAFAQFQANYWLDISP